MINTGDGATFYSRDIYLLNSDALLDPLVDGLIVFDFSANDLGLKVIEKMTYEDDFDLSVNNTNAASVMTALQNSTSRTTDEDRLLMHFATIAATGDIDALSLALEEIRPQGIDANMKIGTLIHDSVIAQISTHAEANSRQATLERNFSLPENSTWVDVAFIGSNTDRVGDFKSYETVGGTLSVGRETSFVKNKVLGGIVGSLSLLETKGLYDDESQSESAYTIQSQAISVSAYTQYLTKNFTAYGVLGGSFHRYDQERTTFLGQIANSQYGSTNTFGKAGAELTTLKNIVPGVYLSHQMLGGIEYTEQGASGENFTVKGDGVDLSHGGAYLRLQAKYKEADLSIVPYFKVETRKTLSGSDGVKFENSFAGNSGLPSFENTTNPFTENATILGAGVDVFESTSASKTSISYQMTEGETTTDHFLSLQVNMMF